MEIKHNDGDGNGGYNADDNDDGCDFVYHDDDYDEDANLLERVSGGFQCTVTSSLCSPSPPPQPAGLHPNRGLNNT